MRLINVQTLELEEFFGHGIPPYAILSHTWGGEEVNFQEWRSEDRPTFKSGYRKIMSACHRADNDGYLYLWCDTNCINQESSAELSEAINSMYAWYRDAGVCYVYLSDVDWFQVPDSDKDPLFSGLESLRLNGSRWMTRGWTLQELLAPRSVRFFARDWRFIGTRDRLAYGLSIITKIPECYLKGSPPQVPPQHASVFMKMNWLAKRETTRIEDMAYCMLGIFDVNISPIYGEGNKAFIRLQEEIVRSTHDQTIFCWDWDPELVPRGWTGLLAPTPKVFYPGLIPKAYYAELTPKTPLRNSQAHPVTYAMSNGAMNICLPAEHSFSFSLLQLDVDPGQGLCACLVVSRIGDVWNQSPFWRRSPISPQLVLRAESIKGPPRSFLIPQNVPFSALYEMPSSQTMKIHEAHRDSVAITFLYSSLDSLPDLMSWWPYRIRQYYGEWEQTEGRFYLAPVGLGEVFHGVLGFDMPDIDNNSLKGKRWGSSRLTVFFACKKAASGAHEFFAEVIPEPTSGYEETHHEPTPNAWRLKDRKENAEYMQRFEALTQKAILERMERATVRFNGTLVFDLRNTWANERENFMDEDGNHVRLIRFCPHNFLDS